MHTRSLTFCITRSILGSLPGVARHIPQSPCPCRKVPRVLLALVSVGPRPLSALLWKMIGVLQRYMCRCCRISCTGIDIGDRDEGVSSYGFPPSNRRTTKTKEVADHRDQGLTDTSQGAHSYATSSHGSCRRCLILPKLTLGTKVVSIISRDKKMRSHYFGESHQTS